MTQTINEIKEKIIYLVENRFGFKKVEFMEKSRRNEIIKPRFIFYALLSRSGISISAISRMFGKDHTTIMNAVKKAEERYKQELDSFSVEYSNPIEMLDSKSPYATGRSKKWEWVYKLYEGKCAICGFSDVVQIHHIKPRSVGGTDNISNLIVLCPNHHALHHLGLVDISNLSTPRPQNPQD